MPSIPLILCEVNLPLLFVIDLRRGVRVERVCVMRLFTDFEVDVDFAVGNPPDELSRGHRQVLVAVLADAHLARCIFIALLAGVEGLKPTAIAGPPRPGVFIHKHMLQRTDEFSEGDVSALRAEIHLTVFALDSAQCDLLAAFTPQLLMVHEPIDKEAELMAFETFVLGAMLQLGSDTLRHALTLFEMITKGFRRRQL